MNLPNKLTVLRVIMIPFFVAALMINAKWSIWTALVLFAAASVTDWFDGKLARKHNLVTNFGKFLDPLADKMLVMSALVCFAAKGWCDAAAVIIILAREFMVSGLRLVTANEGIVVAAGIWGKLKTAFTMIAIVAIMCIEGIVGHSDTVYVISEILIWISVVFTVVSGGIYLKTYRSYINPNE
jgi:CDP-diacylglycerol--glycerol-3-phosphate 3-phosphatidyltransferase